MVSADGSSCTTRLAYSGRSDLLALLLALLASLCPELRVGPGKLHDVLCLNSGAEESGYLVFGLQGHLSRLGLGLDLEMSRSESAV